MEIIKYQIKVYLILQVMNGEAAKVFEYRSVTIKVVREEVGHNIFTLINLKQVDFSEY